MRDPIERQDAIDAVKCGALSAAMVYGRTDEGSTTLYETVKAIKNLPSAQPDYIMNEWCTDCKEYDQERHCCPRFNKVIRTALQDAQPEDYTEMKQEFLRMASYIDVILECSDVQKETLMGFISRLAEFMPWTERD